MLLWMSNYDWTVLQSTNHVLHRIILHCTATSSGSEKELRTVVLDVTALNLSWTAQSPRTLYFASPLGEAANRVLDLTALSGGVFSVAFG
jgi:hypothetical protein